MSDVKQMIQCHLERPNDDGSISTQLAWIESRAAKLWAHVELLPSRELWRVTHVARDVILPADILKEAQDQRRKGLPSIRDTAKDKRRS